jgi:hypothetical protein
MNHGGVFLFLFFDRSGVGQSTTTFLAPPPIAGFST